MGDSFYGSKDPTNSIKVLKEKAVKENNAKKHTKKHKLHICIHTLSQNSIQIQHTRINTASPLVYNYMGWLGDGTNREVARPERRWGCCLECRKKQLNQGSFVLLYFVLFAFSELCLVFAMSVSLLWVCPIFSSMNQCWFMLRKSKQHKIKQYKTTLVQLLLTTLDQETQWS